MNDIMLNIFEVMFIAAGFAAAVVLPLLVLVWIAWYLGIKMLWRFYDE